MNLYPSHATATAALQSSRMIKVIDTRGGKTRKYWACPDQALRAACPDEEGKRPMPGLFLHRNRRGVVNGAMLVHTEDPSTARYISASAAGALRVQKLQSGLECYALTNAAGAIIGG